MFLLNLCYKLGHLVKLKKNCFSNRNWIWLKLTHRFIEKNVNKSYFCDKKI